MKGTKGEKWYLPKGGNERKRASELRSITLRALRARLGRFKLIVVLFLSASIAPTSRALLRAICERSS